jgi:uncharacterized protein
MSHFVVLAWDAPDSAAARAATRDAHFAHISTVVDRIAVAGPLKDDAGATIGSLFVLSVESAAAAEALLRADPYFTAGIWAKWSILPFVAAAGTWVGGTTW